jgi:hypothetical protein
VRIPVWKPNNGTTPGPQLGVEHPDPDEGRRISKLLQSPETTLNLVVAQNLPATQL